MTANCIRFLSGKQESLNKNENKEDRNQVPFKEPKVLYSLLKKDGLNKRRSMLWERRLERGGDREDKEHNYCGC